MGHEMTGEVIEVGSDVEVVKKGDIVSVPFNVGCGRCYNCKHMRSDVCENTNPEIDCGAYGFNLGGWTGAKVIISSYRMRISISFASLTRMPPWKNPRSDPSL